MIIRRNTKLGSYCACISIALNLSMVTMVSEGNYVF